MTHDEVTALASELWSEPVYERRLAAVVLLQSNIGLLRAGDLTRLEGFLRDARVDQLVDPLARDVVKALVERMSGADADRARRIIDRWAEADDPQLRRAAAMQ